MAGRAFAPGTSFCRRAMAAFTLCSLRPLMMISAPLSAGAFGDGEANTRRGGGDQRDFSR